MNDLQTYCQYLYNHLSIPLYLIQNGSVTACWPEQDPDFFPPVHYIETLQRADSEIALSQSSLQTYFGRIAIQNSDYTLFIGPVSPLPYNREMMKSLCREYHIKKEKAELFSSFFRNIPISNYSAILNFLLLINLNLNGTTLQQKDISNHIVTANFSSVNEKHSSETYQLKENDTVYDNYDIEQELLFYIETGNIKKLKEFSQRIRHTFVGTIATDALRQLKNTCLVTLTLASRAAIRGGLPSGIAYSLSNAYCQHIEQLTDVKSLALLAKQIQEDYCVRVAERITPPVNDNMMLSVIRYVQNNTNKNLKSSDIAEHMGYSAEYLSRRFKKELGFGLKAFIRRCKLEESKMLLSYTNMSISEISAYLCFSSQSHFQKSFKEQYKITPLAFRHTASVSTTPPLV